MATVHATRKSTLKVMTLNLWGPNKWPHRRSAVVEWINEIQPDLLALQEVVRRVGMDQASWIAERTGMTAVFGPVRGTFGGVFGNAVLSRLPVKGSQCRPLTDAGSGNEPRGMLTVDVDAGRPVSFTSTHLSWQFDEGWVRERQVRDVASVVNAQPSDTLVVVAGDFNAEPHSAEMRYLKEQGLLDAFEAAHPGRLGYTWCNENPYAAPEHEPDRRIDYVLIRPRDKSGRVISADVVCNQPRGGVWPTDHFGVAAELTVRLGITS